jgi:hypothetical protein
MDLVERYIQSVRSLLPKAQQDDIAEELEGAIRARIEARETELGRKLKQPEVEAILQEIGHPIAVAGRYAPQRHLIGPDIYPFWWIAVKLAVVLSAIIALARGLGDLVSGDPGNVPGAFAMAWGVFWSTGLFLVGLITVIGAVMEHYKIQPFAKWSAKDLKTYNVGAAWPDFADAPVRWGWRWGPRARTRAGAAATLFFALIGLGLWGFLPLYIHWLPSELNPIWWLGLWGITLSAALIFQFWALMLVQSAAQAGVHAAELFRPDSVRVRSFPALIASVLSAAIAYLALKVTGLLYLPLPHDLHDMSTLETIEHGFQLALGLTLLLSALYSVVHLWRLVTGGVRPLPATA